MKTYYYLDKQQQQQGPITIGELSKCIKTRNTPIWREDMSDWQAAGSVPELSSIFTPPPIPVITPPPIIQPSAEVTSPPVVVPPPIIQLSAVVMPPPVVSPPPIIQPSAVVTPPPVVSPPPIIQPSAVVTPPPVVVPPPIIQPSAVVTPPPVVSPPPIIQPSAVVIPPPVITPPPIIQPSVEETAPPKPKVSIFLAPPQVSAIDLPQWQKAIKGIVAAQRELWGEELTAFVALEKLFNSANFELSEIGVHIQAIKDGIPEYDQNRLLKTHLENFIALYEKYFTNIPSKKLK